ncbi:endonuclease [Alteromonas pelagimontana]|uniref:Endonuclease n=1 Tax=Alteromonas pelagimontana TaxID=1858656 RepID=A0A6M4MH40_9ALTE|nr:endonuclease/exonuclease/phosphatase family protein [Alteromonas pelagimontana]QJR82297.1 endonuclease [Alteromonas pelagimontana]
MFETLSLMSTLLLFTTIAPLLPGEHWTIRVWEFPRVQLFVLLLVTLLGWGINFGSHLTTSLVFMVALGAAIFYQVLWIIPYTRLWKKEVVRVKEAKAEQCISVMTSNVYMYNENYAGLKGLVKENKPDLLITLETNGKWEKELAELHDSYPHRLACPLENLYGMHLYSRIPFKAEKIRYIIEEGVPSMEITIELAGQEVVVYCLHPKPPSPTENETAGPRDAELAVIGREVAEKTVPVIVAGDLNDVAWSPTTRKFRKSSGAKDPRRGRGFFNTFHAKYPPIRWPLDHVFHSAEFELVHIKRLPGYGSDHFPLLTKLQLNPNRIKHVSSSDQKTGK